MAIKKVLIPCCLLFLAILISCVQESNKPLTIAISSNMQFSMEEISAKFSESTGIPCELVIGSSGKLTAQIMEGAPFDVFLSADMKYPQKLFENGLTSTAPRVYAHGKLVLYALNAKNSPELKSLGNPDFEHIAMANPKTAPYGQAAMEVLEHYGLKGNLKHKLVFGESISQTNQFLASGAAQVGFTAKSAALSSAMRNEGKWMELDQNSYRPIEQGIVLVEKNILKDGNAHKFYEFIFSGEAQKILKKYGYSVDE